MKKMIIAVVVSLIIIFCFLIGNYISKIISMGDRPNQEIAQIEAIEDECTAEYENYEAETASAKEEKISPNAKVVVNIFYEECGHTVTTEHTIEPEYINRTKEELEKIYEDYEIREFSKDKVELYKEEKGICNEHYVVSDKDGFVAVYALDSEGKKVLQQVTEISTAFLTSTDVARLQGGIMLYGNENLNKLLEDLE